jgi:Domain of unknown function (DUF6265)
MSKRKAIKRVWVAALALGLAIPATAGAEGCKTTTVADLGWFAGAWEGELDGGRIEEHWSAPAGTNVMGMFRYVKDGKVVFYELMAIDQEAEGPALRIKHFYGDLTGWEEKAEVVDFRCVAAAPGQITWSRPKGQGEVKLSYRSEAGKLAAVLDKTDTGPRVIEEFAYTRIGGR